MGKKPDELAPSHMGLYASLMTILLAFFILLTTMTDEQEAGFKEGSGMIRNAFGLKGGFGLLQYYRFTGGPRLTPEIDEGEEDDDKDKEIPEFDQMMGGSGGSGNIGKAYDRNDRGHYVLIRLPHRFEKGSTRISNDMANYLQKAGMGFALFDYGLNIRCIATETGSHVTDQALAARRAATVMRFLDGSGVSYSNMRATGYSSSRYFSDASEEGGDIFICIFASSTTTF